MADAAIQTVEDLHEDLRQAISVWRDKQET
jgi:hypothetical protein